MAEGLDESTSEPTSLELQIIRQVEYYFGDYNLVRDKFLQEAIKQDNDGWVPIDTLTTFNRLKILATDHKIIADALKKSKTQLMEIHEDGSKVRRSLQKALPTNDNTRKEEVNARSVYLKGFPKDATLDELLEFFKQHGPVVNLQMRYFSKIFKGSVFAVFATLADAEEFLKKEEVKYKPEDIEKLLIESKPAYFARKQEEKGKAKAGRKAKQTVGAKNDETAAEPAEVDEGPKYEKGLVIEFTGVKEGVSIENVKATFKEYSPVAWVDFARGQTEGFLRFQDGNPAEKALEKAREANDGKVKIGDNEITVRILEGDEETEYWKKCFQIKKEFYQRSKAGSRGRDNARGGGRGRRGFRGGRGGGGGRGNRRGGGRSRDDDSDGGEDMSEEKSNKRSQESTGDEPSAKKTKVEASDAPKLAPAVDAAV